MIQAKYYLKKPAIQTLYGRKNAKKKHDIVEKVPSKMSRHFGFPDLVMKIFLQRAYILHVSYIANNLLVICETSMILAVHCTAYPLI